jgi:isoleucyl-tRNA synthetase
MAKKPEQNPVKTAEEGLKKSPAALAEEEILRFWRDNKIFEKSLAKPSPAGNYAFYDGPPFATGLPHYGHILVSAIKDAVPRYQTMRGKHVERRWGWDCHGLPIENIVEKDLKVSGKKEIEALGVDRFNEYARSKVLDYADQWKETVERIGRWVDYDGSYKTMDNTFIESVWWALKSIWDKKLIYEGTKVLPYCPRCETPVSNSEIAMDGSYKDITDISVYVKLAVENEPKTFLIVWTTTPWTLPGNTAVAVNPDLDYVIAKIGDEYYIVGKDKTSIFKESFEIVEEIKGSALVGKKYTPPFDYFAGENSGQSASGAVSATTGKDLPNKENGWQVYPASYVTAETGSGIVHLAPAYGEEDMALAKQYNIPFVRHVGFDGKFVPEVTDFAGQKAKPKEDHQASDVLIIKNLAARGLLFAKEKIVHSYPHCFRCETPLYYFALPAWFIKITDVKKDIVSLNDKINWVPEHLKYGRFGNSIAGAPDWNISRNRYWASPLPFWRCQKCDKVDCVGSQEELAKRSVAKNSYFIMRHGEAEHNLTDTVSCLPTDKNGLTEKGRAQTKEVAEALKNQHIDVIYSSDTQRAKETAEILARDLGVAPENVFSTPEITELQAGEYNGKTWKEYRDFFGTDVDQNGSPTDEVLKKRFETAPAGGETLLDIRNRATKFLYDLEKKHEGKKILIISHGDTIFLMERGMKGYSPEKLREDFKEKSGFLGTGEFKPLGFSPMPINKDFTLDFHRPYIDEITLACVCGGEMKRVPEVVDGWFESGSMPFAQHHYPFENKKKFDDNFPAQFIVEYIAQTRTWFYYTHAVSVLLFGDISFENVLATGTVLAEDGEKMSKSKGNFPNPALIFNKYSVDALRFYLLSSPLMKAEDLNFAEKGVDEVHKKIVLRLKNVVTFYETYKGEAGAVQDLASTKDAPSHVLDLWITERMNELVSDVTAMMEAYEIDKALAPIDAFVEDLSVWFLRRSRERLKSEDERERARALATFRAVLLELSKVIAPFTPFLAEEMYKKITAGSSDAAANTGAKESVHLEDWPETRVSSVGEVVILSDMSEVRRVVSLALEARASAKIKVRQPLQTLTVKSPLLQGKTELLALIQDEVNVKEIAFDLKQDSEVVLDTKITDELQKEGNLRELVRFIQDLRKKSDLKPGESAVLTVLVKSAAQKFIEEFADQIKKSAAVSEIIFAKDGEDFEGESIEIDGHNFTIKIK